ncbi:MAG: hypothetical protein OHK0019_32020 [Saprospiraceae bacterium]
MLDYLENEGAYQAAENLTANVLKRMEVLKNILKWGDWRKRAALSDLLRLVNIK